NAPSCTTAAWRRSRWKTCSTPRWGCSTRSTGRWRRRRTGKCGCSERPSHPGVISAIALAALGAHDWAHVLSQLEARPEVCRLHSIVAAWYAGKTSARCNRTIGAIVWHDRPPALLGPDGGTREWSEVAPKELPELFRTH